MRRHCHCEARSAEAIPPRVRTRPRCAQSAGDCRVARSWQETKPPLPLREGVGGAGRAPDPALNPLPQGEGSAFSPRRSHCFIQGGLAAGRWPTCDDTGKRSFHLRCIAPHLRPRPHRIQQRPIPLLQRVALRERRPRLQTQRDARRGHRGSSIAGCTRLSAAGGSPADGAELLRDRLALRGAEIGEGAPGQAAAAQPARAALRQDRGRGWPRCRRKSHRHRRRAHHTRRWPGSSCRRRSGNRGFPPARVRARSVWVLHCYLNRTGSPGAA